MPSPFPGMNPYLEQVDLWQDFHERFVPAISDALAPQVSPHFIVKLEAHLYIREPEADLRIRAGNPDVGVIRSEGGTATKERSSSALSAPGHLLLPEVDIEGQCYIEVQDRQSREVVAVIEVLSPTNKRSGPDREQYLAKRGRWLRSDAHFVEIDLLRGWHRMPGDPVPVCDYLIIVSRVEDRPTAGYWPIGLRDGLPTIPIPLRPPLKEAWLDVKHVLENVYDRAYYKDHIYQGSPNPPLCPEDAAWAAALVPKG